VLIVLSGPSCSGKTALARALQSQASRPLVHWEADRLWPAMPEHPFAASKEYGEQVVLAVHASIAALGRTLDVVVGGSLPNDRRLQDRCIAVLRSTAEVKLVAVRCAADVLHQREAVRPDRQKGWAESQLATIFEGVEFDAVVDTTNRSPEDCARELLGVLLFDWTS
jgi:chloramphenicol 3-O phosphotransferase